MTFERLISEMFGQKSINSKLQNLLFQYFSKTTCFKLEMWVKRLIWSIASNKTSTKTSPDLKEINIKISFMNIQKRYFSSFNKILFSSPL